MAGPRRTTPRGDAAAPGHRRWAGSRRRHDGRGAAVIEEPITSPRNPRVAAARALRDRRRRDETGLTLVDGAREVWRAMQAGVELETVFVCPPLIHGPDGAAVLDALAALARTGRDVRLEGGPQAHERLACGGPS